MPNFAEVEHHIWIAAPRHTVRQQFGDLEQRGYQGAAVGLMNGAAEQAPVIASAARQSTVVRQTRWIATRRSR